MYTEIAIRNYMLDFLEQHSDRLTDSCVEYVRNIPISISKKMKKSLEVRVWLYIIKIMFMVIY